MPPQRLNVTLGPPPEGAPAPNPGSLPPAGPGLAAALADWARENPLDATALAATPVPIVGDLAGFANDIRHYVNEPGERRWQNYALTGLGLLPFVPPAMPITRFAGKLANGKSTADHVRDAAYHEPEPDRRVLLAQLLQGK